MNASDDIVRFLIICAFVFIAYWVIRFAVSAGMRDAWQRRAKDEQRAAIANPPSHSSE